MMEADCEWAEVDGKEYKEWFYSCDSCQEDYRKGARGKLFLIVPDVKGKGA